MLKIEDLPTNWRNQSPKHCEEWLDQLEKTGLTSVYTCLLGHGTSPGACSVNIGLGSSMTLAFAREWYSVRMAKERKAQEIREDRRDRVAMRGLYAALVVPAATVILGFGLKFLEPTQIVYICADKNTASICSK